MNSISPLKLSIIHTALFCLTGLLSSSSNAQNKINSYRYWFDSGYSSAVTQNITPAQNYTLSAQISTSALLQGLHLFNVKFMDDSNRASLTNSSFFYKTPPSSGSVNITRYQFWFDGDFANAITQNASGTPGFSFNNNINAVNLLNGLHLLQFRFKDDKNLWSETLSHFFYKTDPASGTNNIIAYQYWLDQNFAGVIQQSITLGTAFSLSAPVDAQLLLEGLHVLQVRFLDNNHRWSSTLAQFFYKAAATDNNNISRVQYWFDQNFSGAVTQPITPSATYNLSAQVNAADLLTGLHAISIRFSDIHKKWSSTTTQFFYKEKPDTVIVNKITGYRYWFDEGDSSMNLVNLAPFMNTFILNEQIVPDGMDSGKHVIHFQFRDIKGKWSMVTSDSAVVTPITIYTFNGNGNWSDVNNWVNKRKPPLVVSGDYKIFIDPAPGGQCVLDVAQYITAGAVITVRSGKSFVIPGNLNINQ